MRCYVFKYGCVIMTNYLEPMIQDIDNLLNIKNTTSSLSSLAIQTGSVLINSKTTNITFPISYSSTPVVLALHTGTTTGSVVAKLKATGLSTQTLQIPQVTIPSLNVSTLTKISPIAIPSIIVGQDSSITSPLSINGTISNISNSTSNNTTTITLTNGNTYTVVGNYSNLSNGNSIYLFLIPQISINDLSMPTSTYTTMLNNITTSINTTITNAVNADLGFLTKIPGVSGALTSMINALESIIDDFAAGIITIFFIINGNGQQVMESFLQSTITNIIDNKVINPLNNALLQLTTIMTSVLNNTINQSLTSIVTDINNLINGINKSIDNIETAINQDVGNITSELQSTLNNIIGTLNNILLNVYTNMENSINAITSIINTIITDASEYGIQTAQIISINTNSFTVSAPIGTTLLWISLPSTSTTSSISVVNMPTANVTNTNLGSGNLNVTISPTGSLQIFDNTATNNNTITFTASVSNGTSPYTYIWYVNNNAVPNNNSNTLTLKDLPDGTYSVYCSVTDAKSNTGSSNISTVTAVPPTLYTSISPSGPITMADNTSKQFTSTVENGSGNYTYQWYFDNQVISNATGSSFTLVNPVAGKHTLYMIVTDTSTHNTATSNTVNITSTSTTTTTQFSASVSPSGTVNVNPGSYQNFTVSVNNGTTGSGNYAYEWYLNGNGTGVNTTTYDFMEKTAGTYHLYVIVTDKDTRKQITSNTVTVIVTPALSVSISPSGASQSGTESNPVIINTDESQLITVDVSNGSGSYDFYWYVNNKLKYNPNNQGYWTFDGSNGAGNYTIQCDIKDTKTGNTASSNIIYITVQTVSSSNMTASITPSGTTTIYKNHSATFTATASGGTSPYKYQWYLNGNQSSNTGDTLTLSNPGYRTESYSLYVIVSDSAGHSIKSNTVTVDMPGGSTSNTTTAAYLKRHYRRNP